MGIYTPEFLNKKFNLKEALINDEVDLIFGYSEELLEEIAHIKGKNNMQILIRNLYEDQTDGHWFSMKFISNRKIKGDTHNDRKGIPIVFNKIMDTNGDIRLSDWKVMLGGSTQLSAKSEQLQKQLNTKEKAFITAIVEELGFIILEYWELNPNDKQQYNRMLEIRDHVQSQYSK